MRPKGQNAPYATSCTQLQVGVRGFASKPPAMLAIFKPEGDDR